MVYKDNIYSLGFKDWLDKNKINISLDKQEDYEFILKPLIFNWLLSDYKLKCTVDSYTENNWYWIIVDIDITSQFGSYEGDKWYSDKNTVYKSKNEAEDAMIVFVINLLEQRLILKDSGLNNKTIIISDFPIISYDLYFNNAFIKNISQMTMMDLREQLSRNYIAGYSLRIPELLYYLFDTDVSKEVVNITEEGKVDKWFPQFQLSDYYRSVDYGSALLAITLKIRDNQLGKQPY